MRVLFIYQELGFFKSKEKTSILFIDWMEITLIICSLHVQSSWTFHCRINLHKLKQKTKNSTLLVPKRSYAPVYLKTISPKYRAKKRSYSIWNVPSLNDELDLGFNVGKWQKTQTVCMHNHWQLLSNVHWY